MPKKETKAGEATPHKSLSIRRKELGSLSGKEKLAEAQAIAVRSGLKTDKDVFEDLKKGGGPRESKGD